MIFADGDEIPGSVWEAVKWVALIVGGSAIPWLWARLNEWRTNRRKESKEDAEERRRIEKEDGAKIDAVNDKLIARMEKERTEILAKLEKSEQLQEKKELECQKRIDSMGSEMKDMRIEMSNVREDHARAVAWIEHFQFQLREAKIPFRSWKDTPVPPAAAEIMQKAGLVP